MKRLVLLGATIVSGVLLAACGISSDLTTGSIPTSWVVENSRGGVDGLIQWVPNGGSQFTGTFTVAYISSDGRHMDTNNSSVSGLTSNGAVEITIDGTQYSGKISSSTLLVRVPISSGAVSNLTFVPGNTSEYNRFLGKLQSKVTSNVNTYNQQQATAAEQQSVQSNAQTVSADISNVNGAISQLQSYVQGAASDLAQEKSDLGTTESDYSTAQQALDQYGTGSGNGACEDANEVAIDANSVWIDLNSISNNIRVVQQDISQLQSVTSQLQTDATQLGGAEAAIPGYIPSGTPSTANVDAAVSKSQAATSQAVSTMNGYIPTANSYEQQAYTLADQAKSSGNCGNGPTAPSKLSAMSG